MAPIATQPSVAETPASTLASSRCSASKSIASATVVGASYSKGGSFISMGPSIGWQLFPSPPRLLSYPNNHGGGNYCHHSPELRRVSSYQTGAASPCRRRSRRCLHRYRTGPADRSHV